MRAEAGVAESGIDLAALRRRLAEAPDAERLRPVGLQRVLAGPDALSSLPAVLAELIGEAGGAVALLADATPIRRAGESLKPQLAADLSSRWEVRAVRVGPADGHVQADEGTLAAARAAAEGAAAVVSVGSGTVADIGKVLARDLGGLPHAIVQTAASVNGFADDQSVLLRNGVKRTEPSRWPEVLVLDGTILAEAPAAMSRAGLGDLVSMFTAVPDWYLAGAVGMDESFSTTAVALGREHGAELLGLAPALGRNETAAVIRLGEILALSGISMGVAGRTAPSSGMEHTVSHLLEMVAARRGTETALHGAKVGVATVVAAFAWRRLRRQIAEHGLQLLFPAPGEMEERVRAAFAPLDPSGSMAAECWLDYSAKLARWHERRGVVEAFAARWSEHLEQLDAMVIDPALLVEAMKAAGAPTRFSDLEPAVDAATARWAVASCHLMRDRFTVADLACFSGCWTEHDVAAVLCEASALGAGL